MKKIKNNYYRHDILGLNPEWFIVNIVPVVSVICIIILSIITLMICVKKIRREYIKSQTQLEEEIAHEKYVELLEQKENSEILQKLLQKELEKEINAKILSNTIESENKYYTKKANEVYPIGTYILVKDKGYVGQVREIRGEQIKTKEGWVCYYGIDNITYLSYKEYKKLLKGMMLNGNNEN